MPLQNRVTPSGDIVAIPERGLFTGNRGIIHDPATRTLLRKRWSTPAWLTCVLEFRGRRRKVMGGRSWTELFFLDEATALAAGHRPCGYCRRRDFLAVAGAWQTAQRLARRPQAREMDAVLHRERVGRSRRQVTRTMDAGGLPDGVMIRVGGSAGLLISGRLRPWSLTGYGAAAWVGVSGPVEVLTPPAIIAAIAAGYQPLVHPTALPESPPVGGMPPQVRVHERPAAISPRT
jgi:hypothetical protein